MIQGDSIAQRGEQVTMKTMQSTLRFATGRWGLVGMLLVAMATGRLVMAEPAPSALEADGSGWLDILPRADLAGWNRVSVPPGKPLGKEQWHLDATGKMLVCEGDGGHDMLLYGKEFGDAVFHCEFRYTKVEGKTGYNSGIYIRNNQDGSIWHQAQFGDANGGYLFGESPTADGGKTSFSTKDTAKADHVKPAGEWNTLELTAKGQVVTLWLNGEVTSTFEACGNAKGVVGLEGEGYRIEFRNLKVKALD